MNFFISLTKRFAPLFAAILLTACATSEQTTKRLGAEWKGQHIDSAISKYGAPAKVTDLTLGKVYQWRFENGSSTTGSVYGNAAFVNQRNNDCDIRMTTDEQSIVTFLSWEGYSCP